MRHSMRMALAIAPVIFSPIHSAAADTKHPSDIDAALEFVANGRYGLYSQKESEIPGFAVGHEGERGKERFSADHSEIIGSLSAHNMLAASIRTALSQHEDETEVGLEEIYLETLPDMGLPQGLQLKAGRAFWTLGLLNGQHKHEDDFADRPLPYRLFLDGGYNDEGAQITYKLPTSIDAQIGGGLYRGDAYPFGHAPGGVQAWSLFARASDKLTENQQWRVGGYVLSGDAHLRGSNEKEVEFVGDSTLYILSAGYDWAPTGKAHEQKLTLEGEYFQRHEKGSYEDFDAGTGIADVDGRSSGWYTQALYRFMPDWRVGMRYSQMDAMTAPAALAGSALDADGYTPKAYAAMVDWDVSESTLLRLQYNREELMRGKNDHQLLAQVTFHIGTGDEHHH